MKRTKVVDVLQLRDFGAIVNVKGWVRTHRSSKAVDFIALNDGSTINNVQIVVDPSKVDDNLLKQITTGSCISVVGALVESQGQGQAVEIQADEIEIYGLCGNDYPMQKKGQSFEYMRQFAHLRLRTNTFGAVMRIRHNMAMAIHTYFHEHGYFYFHTPLITASDCEGAGQMFQVTTKNLYDLKKNDLPLPKSEFDWTEQPFRISEGKTLFWPCATWALWEADLSKFGKPDEIMFVPMPKDPEADKYYLPANMDAYALCKGAGNPEGAAAFIKCKLIAEKDENSLAITEKQYREDYGWTDEMVEMWYKVRELTDANPVVSLHMGIPKDYANIVDDSIKQASFNGKDWAVTREEISDAVQSSIDELNEKIKAMS